MANFIQNPPKLKSVDIVSLNKLAVVMENNSASFDTTPEQLRAILSGKASATRTTETSIFNFLELSTRSLDNIRFVLDVDNREQRGAVAWQNLLRNATPLPSSTRDTVLRAYEEATAKFAGSGLAFSVWLNRLATAVSNCHDYNLMMDNQVVMYHITKAMPTGIPGWEDIIDIARAAQGAPQEILVKVRAKFNERLASKLVTEVVHADKSTGDIHEPVAAYAMLPGGPSVHFKDSSANGGWQTSDRGRGARGESRQDNNPRNNSRNNNHYGPLSQHRQDAASTRAGRRIGDTSAPQCSRCGKLNHIGSDCRISQNHECEKCGKVGHFAVCCRSAQHRRQSGEQHGDQRGDQREPQRSPPRRLLAPMLRASINLNDDSSLATANEQPDNSSELIPVDSAAADFCLVSNINYLTDVSQGDNQRPSYRTASGQTAAVEAVGTLQLLVRDLSGKHVLIKIPDVAFVPAMAEPALISVRHLDKLGYAVTFGNGTGSITFNKVKINLHLAGGVYKLAAQVRGAHNKIYKVLDKPKTAAHVSLLSTQREKLTYATAHARLGHQGPAAVVNTAKFTQGLDLDSSSPKATNNQCDACIVGKLRRSAMQPGPNASAEQRVGREVHADIFGPLPVRGTREERYCIVLADRASGVTIAHPMVDPALEAVDGLKKFAAVLELKDNEVLLKTDRGGVFLGTSAVSQYCIKRGWQQYYATPHAHATLGFIERRIGLVKEMMRTILAASNLPASYWTFAAVAAAYVINRSSHNDDITPYEKYTGGMPDISNLRPFGCRAYARVSDPKAPALGSQARPCILIGYAAQSTYGTYQLLTTDLAKPTIIESRSVVFRETEFPTIGDMGALSKVPSTPSPDPMHKENRLLFLADDSDEEDDSNNRASGSSQLPQPVGRVQLTEAQLQFLRGQLLQPQAQVHAEPDIALVPLLQLPAAQDQDPEDDDNTSMPDLVHNSASEASASDDNDEEQDHQPLNVIAHQAQQDVQHQDQQQHPIAVISNNTVQPVHTARQSGRVRTQVTRLDPSPAPAHQPKHVRQSYNKPSSSSTSTSSSAALLSMMVAELHTAAQDAAPVAAANKLEPKNYREVMALPPHERQLWIDAMKTEIKQLQDQKCYRLVPIEDAQGHQRISSKWVYRKKTSGVNRARLVALGYMERIDASEDTYSPTIHTVTLRIAVAISVYRRWSRTFTDVKGAFIVPTLNKDLFLNTPPGMHVDEGFIIKLNKTIYGLVHSPRAWNAHLTDSFVNDYGLFVSVHDPCLFFSKDQDGNLNLLVAVHVDDAFVSGEPEAIKAFIKWFGSAYSITIDKEPEYLGMTFKQVDKDTLVIHQGRMIRNLVADFGLANNRGAETPASTLQLPDAPGEQQQPRYREAVGRLQYIAMTRPDISYSIGKVAAHGHSNEPVHFTAVKRILRYLKSSPETGLLYTSSLHLQVLAFSDASWADNSDRKSTGGYMVFAGNNLIDWSSRKQTIIATSSTESEVYEVERCALAVAHTRNVLESLGVKQTGPSIIYVDNTAAIALCQPQSHASRRSRHFEIRMLKVRELIQLGIIKLEYIHTSEQLADILTKSLQTATHRYLFSKIFGEQLGF